MVRQKKDIRNRLIKYKNAQQEIVGFILIVSLVVIALVIFLIISVNKPASELKDAQIDNMLSVMLASTTECAPNYVPNYDRLDELIDDCYNNNKCQNLDKMACESLNSTLNNLIQSIRSTETDIAAYQLTIVREDNQTSEEVIPRLREGNCTGDVRGASRDISDNIVIELRLCYSA